MIYLIEIGKISRRGNFDKLFHKVVSVPDKCGKYAVQDYFSKKYEGFNVRVFPVQEVTDLTTLGEQKKNDVRRETEFFLHFRAKYTEQERKLHEIYKDSESKARDAIRSLHHSIEDRFKALFYSDISYQRPLKLKTDYYGTYCEKLPINGVLFESAVKQSEGDYTLDPPPDLLETPETPEIPPPSVPAGIEPEDTVLEDVSF
jgi:hypothetical protein